ncbi:MAG: TIM barrel protein [Bacillota bacterium]
MRMIRFGTAGNSQLFYANGGKASVDVPAWLKNLGLSAYEYQCGRGVRISKETAEAIGDAGRVHGIAMSIHGPYYINLAAEDPQTLQNTKKHLLKSLEAAQWMGADKVIFHVGGAGKMSRQTAMDRARNNLGAFMVEAESMGFRGIYLCPETAGKRNQLGTLEEILDLCKLSHWLIPTVDFAHLHAVSGGGLVDKDAYRPVLDTVAETLGEEALRNLHIHFSPIEFTAGGEKKHWTLLEPQYGPPFLPLAELIAEMKLTPTIICESDGRQAEDALEYQRMYHDVEKYR